MNKYHYIEIKENEKTLARLQTRKDYAHQDWANKISKYSGFDVQYVVSSTKEKTFNHINQTA